MAAKKIEKMSEREMRAELNDSRRALRMGLEIWDEYMSQIATCVSQDYGRLNEFPMACERLGVSLHDPK
jgi:hypothetical protein